MKKFLSYLLLCGVASSAAGCASSVRLSPAVTQEKDIYTISASGTSRGILSESVKSANDYCSDQNKHYLFVKNIFQRRNSFGVDVVSYDLYFTCVEAGDPRLTDRRPLLRPGEEKEQAEGSPASRLKAIIGKDTGKESAKPGPAEKAEQKPGPEKESPAVATGQESAGEAEGSGAKKAASPGKEPLSGGEKAQAEKKESPDKDEAAIIVDEEQRRKKNPGPGLPENLRKEDGSAEKGFAKGPPIEEEVLVK